MSEFYGTVPAGKTKRLLTKGKYCPSDILIEGKPSEDYGSIYDTKDVNFYDYDGTLLYSYTLNEIQSMTELPPLPKQEGLICQEWNWSLEDIKALGRNVDVGAIYTTDDGKTRIYIHLEEGRTSPMFGCSVNGTVTIDWGDGSSPDILTGNSTSTSLLQRTPIHEYSASGDYIITLSVEGQISLSGDGYSSTNSCSYILQHSIDRTAANLIYGYSIKKIHIGDNVILSDNALFNTGITAISIPYGTTSVYNNSIGKCYALRCINFPSSMSYIDYNVLQSNTSLLTVSLPANISTMHGQCFRGCYCLRRITIPDGVTEIDHTMFQECYHLTDVIIPTEVSTISSSAFRNCYSISKIIIPESVVTIGSQAFSNCQALYKITFKSLLPPTISDANAFYTLPTDCIIEVPKGSLEAYTTATNYPSAETYTYVEVDV